MWLDADDRIDEENCQKIREWKQSPSGKLVFAGYERQENGGTFLYPRIVRRDAGFVWEGIGPKAFGFQMVVLENTQGFFAGICFSPDKLEFVCLPADFGDKKSLKNGASTFPFSCAMM